MKIISNKNIFQNKYKVFNQIYHLAHPIPSYLWAEYLSLYSKYRLYFFFMFEIRFLSLKWGTIALKSIAKRLSTSLANNGFERERRIRPMNSVFINGLESSSRTGVEKFGRKVVRKWWAQDLDPEERGLN